MVLSFILYYLFCWHDEERERGSFMECQRSFIIIKFIWYIYLVFSFDNYAIKLCNEIGLKDRMKLRSNHFPFSRWKGSGLEFELDLGPLSIIALGARGHKMHHKKQLLHMSGCFSSLIIGDPDNTFFFCMRFNLFPFLTSFCWYFSSQFFFLTWHLSVSHLVQGSRGNLV